MDYIRFLFNACNLKRKYIFLFVILLTFLLVFKENLLQQLSCKKLSKFQKLNKFVRHKFCKMLYYVYKVRSSQILIHG